MLEGKYKKALTQNIHKLHVMEIKMLKWMCGITRALRIRNSFIRGSFGVHDIADKIQERRLRRYGCRALTFRASKEAIAGCHEAGHESQRSKHELCKGPCKLEES
ncbi:unnamed protein product [Euphydryas editha]|uniref:Uncharacterized protein n=1 Tax=Euphydryas editha TaxID=104508 RepID=A0AAU9U4F6_EUPED|nr:unnamed protein product [Euphydryas editha]